MTKEGSLKFMLSKQGNMLPLCIAAFLQSAGISIWMVAMPYIVKRFGGTDTQLGVCVSLWFISYLTGCLTLGGFLHRFNPKSTVRFGAGMIAISIAALLWVVVLGSSNRLSFDPILALTMLSASSGIFTSLFWPPLMGWISTGHEGGVLNRRLGLFSVSWSLGGLSTPYFAGLMIERSPVLPITTELIVVLLSFVAICFAINPGKDSSSSQAATMPDDVNLHLLPRFRWMSMVALLCSFVCVGLVKTQLAVFFKEELLFTESDYGTAMLAMSVAIFPVFMLAGKTHCWHYKLLPFIVAQILIFISMIIVLTASSLAVQIVAAIMVGVSEGFLYTSHIYYGVSGAKNRAARMAIHETILALGIACGGMIGGILSDSFTRKTPYVFGLAIIVAGLCIQTIIWFWGSNKTKKIEIYDKNPA